MSTYTFDGVRVDSSIVFDDVGGLDVTFSLTNQSVGTSILSIPDMAGAAGDLVVHNLAQTLTNKTLTSPSLTTPLMTGATMDWSDAAKSITLLDNVANALQFGSVGLTDLLIFNTTDAGELLQLGGAINMGGYRITNMATATASTDAVTKAQLDAFTLGIDSKLECKYATTVNLSAIHKAVASDGGGVGATLTATANGALSIDGASPIVADRVLIKDQYQAETNHLTFTTVASGEYFLLSSPTVNYYVWYQFNGVGVDPAVGGRTGILVDTTQASPTMTELASQTQAVINTYSTGNVFNCRIDPDDTTSIIMSNAAVANALADTTTGTLTSATLTKVYDGDSTGASGSVHNGIYTVTATGDGANPFILTRATDQDGSPAYEVSSGNYTFVTAGATNINTGFSVLTVFPTVVKTGDNHIVGYAAIEWTVFSSAGTFSAGSGIDLTGTVFSLDINAITTAVTALTSADLLSMHDDGAGVRKITWANAQNSITHTGTLDGLLVNTTSTINVIATGAPISLSSDMPSNFTVAGTGFSLTLSVTGGGSQQLVLDSAGTGANAIRIFATSGSGGIDIDAGSGGISMNTLTTGVIEMGTTNTTGAINIGSDGARAISIGSTTAGDTTSLTLGAVTTMTLNAGTINIGSTASTTTLSLARSGLSATFLDKLIVTGDTAVDSASLTVYGANDVSGHVGLALESGNSNASPVANQISFAYGAGGTADDYRHLLRTTHVAGGFADNRITMLLWDNSGKVSTDPADHESFILDRDTGLTIPLENTAVSTSVSVLHLEYNTSGTPAIGIGVGIDFNVESTAGSVKPGGKLLVDATTVALGSEDFRFQFQVMTNGVFPSTVATLSGTGFAVDTIDALSATTLAIAGATATALTLGASDISSTFPGDVSITDATASTSTVTGALIVTGGLGVSGAVFGGSIRSNTVDSIIATTLTIGGSTASDITIGATGTAVTFGDKVTISGDTAVGSASLTVYGANDVSGHVGLALESGNSNVSPIANQISFAYGLGGTADDYRHLIRTTHVPGGFADNRITMLLWDNSGKVSTDPADHKSFILDRDTGLTIPLLNTAASTDESVLHLEYDTSGVHAIGIGVGIDFKVGTSGTNVMVGGTISCITTDLTSAAEEFEIAFKVAASGAAPTTSAKVVPAGLATDDLDALSFTALTIGSSTASSVVISSSATPTIINGINGAGISLTINNGGDLAAHSAVLLQAGNSLGGYLSNQLTFGYKSTSNYRHAIKTRHNSGARTENAYDFYLWLQGTDLSGDIGTSRVLTIDESDGLLVKDKIDVHTAGPLMVGTNTATSIAIGTTGITTIISGGLTTYSGASATSIATDTSTGAINIGTSGARTITIGSFTTGHTVALNLRGDGGIGILAGTGSISIRTAGTGTISIGDNLTTQTIDIGRGGGGNKTIQIGNKTNTTVSVFCDSSYALETAASAIVNISADGVASSLNLGTGAAVKTVVLGSATAGSATSIQGGDGNVSIGTTTTITDTGASTTAQSVLLLEYQTTGVPAIFMGSGIDFATETSAGNVELGAKLTAWATDITLGAEDFAFNFQLMINGAAVTTVANITTTGFECDNIDAVSASTLSIGTSTATAISIAKTGVVSTFADKVVITGDTAVGTNSLTIYGSADTANHVSLALESGNSNSNYNASQITFAYGGWDNADDYRHAIKTRHDSSTYNRNAFDFYLWDPSVAATTMPTHRIMTIDRDEGVSILTSSSTTTARTALRLEYQTTGTPATLIGTAIDFAAETSAGNVELGAKLSALATDITLGSEDFEFNFQLMINGAAVTTVANITSAGLECTSIDTLGAGTLSLGPSSATGVTIGAVGAPVNIPDTTVSTTTWSGALTVAGGLGVGGTLISTILRSDTIDSYNATTLSIGTSIATALSIADVGVVSTFGDKVIITGDTAVGTTSLTVYGSHNTVNHTGLALESGNSIATYDSIQISFAYGGGGTADDYRHAITTRHNANTNANNTMDFFLWDPSIAATTMPTHRIMSLDRDTGVSILTSSATTTARSSLRLEYQTTGTPAIGIGTGIDFATETSAGNVELGARLSAITTNSIIGSENFAFIFDLMSSGAPATTVSKLTNIGFECDVYDSFTAGALTIGGINATSITLGSVGTEVSILDTTASTSTSTGALTIAGGLGVSGAGYFGAIKTDNIVTTVPTQLTIGGSVATSVSIGTTGIVTTVHGPTRFPIPSGLDAYSTGSYTTAGSPTGGVPIMLALTELIDLAGLWGMNVGTNGVWRYDGALQRYYHAIITLTVQESSGSSGDFNLKIQEDSGGGYVNMPGAESNQALLTANKDYNVTVMGGVNALTNNLYRLLATGPTSSLTYTISEIHISFIHMV